MDSLTRIPEEKEDTELHGMPGPATEVPKWVLEAWQRAADQRKAEIEVSEQGS